MKSRYIALLVAPLFSTSVQASSYTGPSVQPENTVTAALEADDDTPVVLQGHITQRLGNEMYEFKDASGQITVEIDDEDLPTTSFDDKTQVRLIGEVDKNMIKREVDVDRVEIVQ
ncbi:MAG: YgiW/YdeI family stress tolerance OB fold protein [Pseudomonas sp.]